MKSRNVIYLLIAAYLFCSCMSQKSCSSSNTSEIPFVDQIPVAKFVEAAVHDTIDVYLYVYTAEYIYLFSDTPIEVYAPGNSPFQFEKDLYKLNPHSLLFPLIISITVPVGMKSGQDHLILLPMRLYFKNKGDKTMRTRAEVIKVPVKIVENETDRKRKHRFMMEYELE